MTAHRSITAKLLAAALALALAGGCAPQSRARKVCGDLEGQIRRALAGMSLTDRQQRRVEAILQGAARAASASVEADLERPWLLARREIATKVLTDKQASEFYRACGLIDYRHLRRSARQMLPGIRRHARALADLGPRQTGQLGCERARQYIRRQLEAILAETGIAAEVKEFSSTVSVTLDRTRPEQLESAGEQFTHVLVDGLDGGQVRWPAYAFQANCVQTCRTHRPTDCPHRLPGQAGPFCKDCQQPRRLVDLRLGRWEDFRGKRLDGAVVLLDFNSSEAWLRAAALGAYGAVFIEPKRTTVFQADAKYRATLPLHFPRLYLRREHGLRLREALASGRDVRITIANRLRWANVTARCLELTIPGKRRDYAFILAGHFDARCIVPDLAYGAAEVWGPAELIELTRYFAQNTPACDVRILFTSGHWQGQMPMRDYVAYDPDPASNFKKVNRYFKLAMGVDLVPEGRSLNLISQGMWDVQSLSAYGWLRQALFTDGGWRDEILRELWLAEQGITLFGGARPEHSGTRYGIMAKQNDRSPFMYAPRYPTAEQPWQALGMTTFAFQTQRLARLQHNTPLDRFAERPAEEIDRQLGPQLEVVLAVLGQLQRYPPELLPKQPARRRRRRGWGGYAQLSGRVQIWDRRVGWFAERLPGADQAGSVPLKSRSNGPGQPGRVMTFIQAYPVDSLHQGFVGTRLRNYLKWPINPSRGQHRQLQAFMFQDIKLLEKPWFRINTIYAAYRETQYNVIGYGVDEFGRIRWASDFGIHGDSNKSFRCTDLDVDGWDLTVPVSLFGCGALELLDLLDPQRYNPSAVVYGSWVQSYYRHGGHADQGVAPHVRVMAVKDVDSHTDTERWGFAQYGPDAMVFLPANHKAGVEILIGQWHKLFTVLNNPDEQGRPRGYRLRPGQTRRLSSGRLPGPLECVRQVGSLNRRRLAEFKKYDVGSPLAQRSRRRAEAALAAGRQALWQGRHEEALAHFRRAWIFESQAYRDTLKLLVDVVSTTVLYFVLLIPFSFLIERLVFPQRTVLRTVAVAAVVFALFAAVLYLFHPGFKLAHNVVVTITAFVIVVMTVPALLLLLLRGVAMLRAIGSKAVITQRSEAESAGVVMASLSLAVSNMRRRRLRTALTLITITTLVVALVLLTTSSAFDFSILEPAGTAGASFQGLQIFNAYDRRVPLLTETAELYETVLRKEALVIRRECVNYGYDPTIPNGGLLLRHGERSVAVPYFQVMDHRDDLVAYRRPARTDQPASAPADAVRTIHLSDLMEGKFLEPGDVDVCLLPNTMAEALDVKVGDTVTLMGLPLKVKGIWLAEEKRIQDGKKMTVPGELDYLTDLDGFPMTALRGAVFRQGQPDSPIHAPSREIVIVPREWIRRYAILPSNVFSLIVIPTGPAGRPDHDRLPALAERLAKEILNADIYVNRFVPDPAGGPARAVGQKISMLTATRVKGSSMMLVMLAAAVLMIIAIMTGTVHERMREIHIFSSVGLSPRHVAGMFFVEALVYAGIAAVLGYFIGIIALKGLLAYLKSTGQGAEFYPNYLGVFVLYSIGMAVLATVASAVYPIRLASRIVNPSEGRTWRLEEQADRADEWRVSLPFIATTWDEARAMMVYAFDYLAIHQGERSGRFVCEQAPAGTTEGNSIVLKMPIWLAPFERNLSQSAELWAVPAPDAPWWQLSLHLRRITGPPYLWRRGATVFVNMLCKHLLRWRAASAEQEADCLARAEKVFPPGSGDVAAGPGPQ